MRDALAYVIRLVPDYLGNLFGLVQRPKRFVAEHISQDGRQLRDALTFLAISFLLQWAVKLPWLRRDPILEFAEDAAFTLLIILLYGAAIYLAWRFVGGRAPVQDFFVIHFYYAGVLYLILALTFLVFMGTLRAIDAGVYDDLLKATYRGDIAAFVVAKRIWSGATLSGLPFLVGVFAALTWLFAGWGAYRELNHLSKLRSALAAMVFFLLWLPVTAAVFFVANALVR